MVYILFHRLSKTSLERNPEPLFLFIYDRFIRVSLKQCNKQEEDSLIGVRAGGGEGAAAPPKFGQLRFFWAARENLGRASF